MVVVVVVLVVEVVVDVEVLVVVLSKKENQEVIQNGRNTFTFLGF